MVATFHDEIVLNSFLTANLAAKVTRRTVNGRSYLIAPASLIVPGVLNGSDGALYYPPEETSKNPAAWDEIPIVVYHPTRNGQPVAAQDPEHSEWVLTNSGVGFLRSSFEDQGRLLAKAWFDEEAVRNYDKKLPESSRILPRLLNNTPIELSTGLHVDREEVAGVCPTTNRPYTAIARNYRPDHLAILPDQRGACSIHDGCGVVVNTENATGKYGNPQDGDTGKFQPNGSGTGKGPVHAAAKEGRHGVADAAKSGYTPEESNDLNDDNPRSPSEETTTDNVCEKVENCSETAMIKNADDSEGKWVTLPNGVHIQVKDGEIVKGPELAKKAKRKVRSEFASKPPLSSRSPVGPKDPDDDKRYFGKIINKETNMAVAMTAEIRKGLVDNLVANCKCGGQASDVEVLNKLSDASLLRLNEHMAAKEPEDDEEEEMDEEETSKVPPQFAKNQKKVTTNQGTTMNQSQIENALAKSMGFRDAGHMKATLNVAIKVEHNERKKLLERLVANVTDNKKKEEVWNRYKDRPINELEDIVSLLPEPVNNRNPGSLFHEFPSYQGAQGANDTVTNAADEEDLLPLPVTNWTEKVGA